MDYLLSGNDQTENLSLQDMIECDIKSEFGEQYTSLMKEHGGNVLEHAQKLNGYHGGLLQQEEDKLFSTTFGDSDSKVDAPTTPSWLESATYSVDSLLTFPGSEILMVNPQTGLPVQHEPTKITVASKASSTASSSTSESESEDDEIDPVKPDFQTLVPSTTTQSNLHQVINTNNLPANCVITSVLATSGSNTATPLTLSFPTSQSSLVTQHLLNSEEFQPLKKASLTRIEASKNYPKPVYSYSCLIAMALKNSDTGALPVSEIYSFMTENFPYFHTAPDGWKNSVRHNLSLNKCFEKIENPKNTGNTRKGCLWGLNPAKIEKMDEEIAKWRKKDLEAIQRSMAKPDVLEDLEKGNIGSQSPKHPNNILKSPQKQQVPTTKKYPTTATLLAAESDHSASGNFQGFAEKSAATSLSVKVEPIVIKPEPLDISGAMGGANVADDLAGLGDVNGISVDFGLQSSLWEELGADGGCGLDEEALSSLINGTSSSVVFDLNNQSPGKASTNASASSPLVSLLTSKNKAAAASHSATVPGGLIIAQM